jgi:hypothetical protein
VGDCHGQSLLDSCGVLSRREEQHLNCEGAKGQLYTEVLL